jgi:hypothetical protein
MTPRFRALGILVVVLVSLWPLSSYSIPFDITHIYLSGECGYLADEVGWWNKDCFGTTTQSGQQSGDWRVSTWYNCNTAEENTRYYQWCGSAWVEVSQSHFETACDCA